MGERLAGPSSKRAVNQIIEGSFVQQNKNVSAASITSTWVTAK
jgi:hypothetical protein